HRPLRYKYNEKWDLNPKSTASVPAKDAKKFKNQHTNGFVSHKFLNCYQYCVFMRFESGTITI
ncbi:hypothetical protein, partial [Yersinia pestis]